MTTRRWPKRLDLYLFAEVAVPFIYAQIIMAVMFIGTEALTEAVKLITRQGLPAWGVFKLMLLRFPWAVGWTLPMSTGMAVILAIGRLCKDTEYTAMIVGGMSYRRIMFPITTFALLVSGLGVWIQEWAGPSAMMAYEMGKLNLIRATSGTIFEPHLRLNPYESAQRVTLSAAELDLTQSVLKDPALDIWEDGHKKASIWAKTGTWDETTGRWMLHNGVILSAADKDYYPYWSFDSVTVADITRYLRAQGINAGIVFDKSPEELSIETTNKPDYLTYSQIRQRIEADIAAGKPANEIGRVQMYLHRRWTLGTSALIFALVGAPLAVRPQRGASLGGAFALGIALVAVYYVTWNATTAIAERGQAPVLWSWSTSVFGVIAGLLLSRRVID